MTAMSSPLTRKRTATWSAIDTPPTLSNEQARKLDVDAAGPRRLRRVDHGGAGALLRGDRGPQPAEDRETQLPVAIPFAELDGGDEARLDPADPVVRPARVLRRRGVGEGIESVAHPPRRGCVEATHDPAGWLKVPAVVGGDDQRLQ